MGNNKTKPILLDAIYGNTDVAEKYDINKDEAFLKYANKSLPIQNKKSRAGLSPYTGTWTVKEQKHLLRRLMFGVSQSDMATIASLTPSQAVDLLLNNAPPAPAPPVNFYEPLYADPTSVPLGQTWVNAAYGDGTVNYYRDVSTKAWWIENMVKQNVSIMEKMILFMSNHFPVEFSIVGDARFNYRYLDLLRTHALGNLKTFIKELTKDGAILRYLNGHYNVKNSPDENYAREVQELFTIGKGTSMYTQTDVVEAAKVLTGWRVDGLNISTAFNATLHETMNKQFSSFYNNTVITGQSGAAGANELDAFVNMLFTKQQEIAKYFARKVYRFFVYYDIDATIESNIIAGLANTLISNSWNIKPMLSQLFKSDHFFDVLSRDCFIRTPLDFYIGNFRTMAASIPASYTLTEQYQCYNYLAIFASQAAMNPGDPPSVSGWPAYYQTPHFHEMWINSDTLPKRMKTMDGLLTPNGISVTPNAKIKIDVIAYALSLSNPANPDVIVNEAVEYLLGIGLSQNLKDYYKSILLSGQSSNFYWTNAWNDYIGSPSNTTYEGIVRGRLQAMLTEMLRMAEHHLS